MKLFLDSEEYAWLTRNAQRQTLSLRSLPAKEQQVKAREVACLVSIVEKLARTNIADPYTFTRPQGRLIQDLVIGQLAILSSRTIPAYQARLVKEPKIKGYLDKCEALYKGLLGLSDKIQRSL